MPVSEDLVQVWNAFTRYKKDGSKENKKAIQSFDKDILYRTLAAFSGSVDSKDPEHGLIKDRLREIEGKKLPLFPKK